MLQQKVHQPISRLDAELPAEIFVRIHLQRIVNVRGIEQITGDELMLFGERHPIGRKYRAGLIAYAGGRRKAQDGPA